MFAYFWNCDKRIREVILILYAWLRSISLNTKDVLWLKICVKLISQWIFLEMSSNIPINQHSPVKSQVVFTPRLYCFGLNFYTFPPTHKLAWTSHRTYIKPKVKTQEAPIKALNHLFDRANLEEKHQSLSLSFKYVSGSF